MRGFFIFCLALFYFSPVMATVTYHFDNQHTYVLWHASHFDFSHPSGKWMAEGTLILDEDKPEQSKVQATIHIADLTTGIKQLNEHLLGPLFFDAKKYPTATFVSDKVVVSGKDIAKVHGILTVHGVSKPVTLEVTLNKQGLSPITNKETIGFSGQTTLKRSDFDINTLLPGISDEIKIEIEAEAVK